MRSENTTAGQSPTFLERARRTQLIQCTLEALAEAGFAGTSIAEVARRAEVSKGVVLYHFGSKRELLESAVEEVYTAAAPDLLEAMESARGHREKLNSYLHGCVLFAWTNQRRLAGLAEIFRNLRGPDGQLRYSHADSDELISFVERLVLDGQRAGEFGDADARTVAVVIRSTIDASTGMFAAEPDMDPQAFSSNLQDLVGRMLATGKARERHV